MKPYTVKGTSVQAGQGEGGNGAVILSRPQCISLGVSFGSLFSVFPLDVCWRLDLRFEVF